MRITLFSLFTLFLTAINHTSIAQDKVIAEEVVAVVGNRSISLSELIETTERVVSFRKTNGVVSELEPVEEAMEMLLNQALFSTYASLDSMEKDLRTTDEEIHKKVDAVIERVGSVKDLEKMSGKTLFQFRDDYKRDMQELELGRMMEQKIRSKVNINYQEVVEFFKTLNIDSLPLMPPLVSYAQIVKVPPATDERRYEVRQRLLEFRERVLGGEKLAVLARLYSQDPGTRANGGEWHSEFTGAVAPFADAVRELKPGQISSIVETEYGFHIIELISKTEKDFVVRHLMLKPEFTVIESEKVSRELDSIATEIRNGKLTFAQAAARHSDDIETRMNGGKVFNSEAYYNRGDMREASTLFIPDQITNPIDSRVLSRLKEGEISNSFETYDKSSNKVYSIMMLQKVIEPHPISMDTDYTLIESEALTTKQNKVLEKWIKDSILKVYVRINPQYLDYKLINEEWKIQNSKCANEE